MQKVTLPERPNWRDHAQEAGFSFADMHGEPYWDIRMHTPKGSTRKLTIPFQSTGPLWPEYKKGPAQFVFQQLPQTHHALYRKA